MTESLTRKHHCLLFTCTFLCSLSLRWKSERATPRWRGFRGETAGGVEKWLPRMVHECPVHFLGRIWDGNLPSGVSPAELSAESLVGRAFPGRCVSRCPLCLAMSSPPQAHPAANSLLPDQTPMTRAGGHDSLPQTMPGHR